MKTSNEAKEKMTYTVEVYKTFRDINVRMADYWFEENLFSEFIFGSSGYKNCLAQTMQVHSELPKGKQSKFVARLLRKLSKAL